MRDSIRELRNGVYEAEILADDDGVTADPHLIRVKVVVLDQDVILDFRGSTLQAQGPINCPFGVTLAGAANALFSLTDPTIPHNQGAFRPIHLIALPGTIVNCDYPVPPRPEHREPHLVAEVVLGALRRARPDRATAPTGATTGLITGGGVHPDFGEFYAFVIWEPTGYGARRDVVAAVGDTGDILLSLGVEEA